MAAFFWTGRPVPSKEAAIQLWIGKFRKEGPMKIRPLHDRVVVKRLEDKKELVRGGIVIPDTAKEKPQEGEVLAVGNGKILDNGTKVPMEVKVGDRILFGKYSGSEVKID